MPLSRELARNVRKPIVSDEYIVQFKPKQYIPTKENNLN